MEAYPDGPCDQSEIDENNTEAEILAAQGLVNLLNSKQDVTEIDINSATNSLVEVRDAEIQEEISFLGDSNFQRFLTKILQKPVMYMTDVHTGRVKRFSELSIGEQRLSQLQKRIIRCKSNNYHYTISKQVYLMIGTNDILRNSTCHIMKGHMLRILASLKSLGVQHIYLCTLPPIIKANQKQKNNLEKLNNFLRRVKDRRIKVYDINKEIMSHNEELIERDGIHLNLRGLKILKSIILDKYTYAEAVNKERRLVDYCLTSEENDEDRNQHRSYYSTKQLHVSPPPTFNQEPQTLIQLNNVSYNAYKDYRAMIDEPIPIIPEASYSLEPREQPEALYELDDNFEIDAQNTPSGRNSNDFESERETRKNKEQSDLINQELLKRISGRVAQLLTLPRLLPEEDNIPKLPFKTIQELKIFETDYSDNVHNAIVNRVSLVSGKDMRTCIFNQLSDVLAPGVGHLCSWAGRNNNYSIQNTVITKILLDATRKNFPETKKNKFENVVKDWLKAGNQRYKRALQKQP
ncbi:hypothetical protein RN001_003774 [Aquatica leii]|uniref:OSK domain-containing protein n=1 Tax=Aquatica leii TaxID=1421715 RepID=A0AAN7SRQ1_9COLE|nr:hypothetical protein RN001_003774 [Aquatica leii]